MPAITAARSGTPRQSTQLGKSSATEIPEFSCCDVYVFFLSCVVYFRPLYHNKSFRGPTAPRYILTRIAFLLNPSSSRVARKKIHHTHALHDFPNGFHIFQFFRI